jgi:hypothetical protein
VSSSSSSYILTGCGVRSVNLESNFLFAMSEDPNRAEYDERLLASQSASSAHGVAFFQQIKILFEKGLKYAALSPNMEIRSTSRRREIHHAQVGSGGGDSGVASDAPPVA